MNTFKQQCIELRKKDHTLNEIVEITGRSKTSVYFHIRDIPLSAKKQREISVAARVRALRISGARKGVSTRPHHRFSKWNTDRVLLVSHLLFDGEIARSKCVYSNRNEALVGRVQRLMRSLYDFEPKVYRNPTTGVQRVGYYNVALGAFLREKSIELCTNVCAFPKAQQREFLRAFFDDEGCMDFRPQTNSRRIRGYQKDRRILHLIKRLLKNFGIESRLEGKNEVVIVGKENLKRFQKEINFSKGVMVNGNRTNSVWKKDREKRELLDMAIRSFKS